MPVKLIKSYDAFKMILDGDKLVISFFSVPWCPRCCQMAPIFRKLSGIYTKAKFIKVDCTEHPDISEFHQVVLFPTFLFFEDKLRRDQLIGGDACMLLKKIQIHYGNIPINFETPASQSDIWKYVDFEFDAEGPEDEALGNNSHFLARMKANCEQYSLVFKELDEQKITPSAFKPLTSVSNVKMNVETKSKERTLQSILAINKQDSADRKTVPLLIRVANIPTDEVDINIKDENPRTAADSERGQKIPEKSDIVMGSISSIKFPELPKHNLLSGIDGPSQLHQSTPQSRAGSRKEIAETKSVEANIIKITTQGPPNQSTVNKPKPTPQVKPGKAPAPQKKTSPPVKKPPPKKKGK